MDPLPAGIQPQAASGRRLRAHGIHLALPDDDFDEAVRIAQAGFDRRQPNAVAGSWRGAGNPLV